MYNPTEKALTELAANVDSAYNAGDAAKMASYWTKDGLNVNPFGDVFEGRAGIEADLRDGLNGFMKHSKHELAISRVYPISEQVVVADGIATISGITGFDGNKMEPLASNF